MIGPVVQAETLFICLSLKDHICCWQTSQAKPFMSSTVVNTDSGVNTTHVHSVIQ